MLFLGSLLAVISHCSGNNLYPLKSSLKLSYSFLPVPNRLFFPKARLCPLCWALTTSVAVRDAPGHNTSPVFLPLFFPFGTSCSTLLVNPCLCSGGSWDINGKAEVTASGTEGTVMGWSLLSSFIDVTGCESLFASEKW